MQRGSRACFLEEEPAEVTEIPSPLISRELIKRWSYFIRKVYETDPLVCPKCSGEMHIISFIDQLAVIKKTSSTLRFVGGVSRPACWGSFRPHLLSQGAFYPRVRYNLISKTLAGYDAAGRMLRSLFEAA